MKNIEKIVILVVSVFLIINIEGCEDSFDYSPYAANVKDAYKDIGKDNLNAVIEADTLAKSEFKFAIFCDPHFNFHELDCGIDDVNRKDSIDFLVVNGDIADHGYLKEFELFHNTMKGLRIPYLTAIGNHDYRSNGEDVYKEMYGKFNYTFEYNNNLFIIWDDIFWESNKSPDWEWLEKQLVNNVNYKKVFVICHIPPFSSQFNNQSEERYVQLMSKYKVDLSIHGHTHHKEYSEYYNDGINYVVGNDMKDKEYFIVNVSEDNISVEFIKY